MNKLTATGRVVADAETRAAGSDTVTKFRLASDVGYGDRKSTNWFSCEIWGKRGESVAQYLTKGQQLTVFGTLTLREWTSKEGVKNLSPEIRIDEVELQGGKQDRQDAPANPQGTRRPAPANDIEDDAIPF